MKLHRPTFTPRLIRANDAAVLLGMSRSGFDKLARKDPQFPKPIKDGNARQAAVYYVAAEIEAWLQARMDARGAA